MSRYCVISKYIQYKFMINGSARSLIFALFGGHDSKTVAEWNKTSFSSELHAECESYGYLLTINCEENKSSVAVSKVCGVSVKSGRSEDNPCSVKN